MFFVFQTIFQTELGQTLDLMTAPAGQIDLNRFTMERCEGSCKLGSERKENLQFMLIHFFFLLQM